MIVSSTISRFALAALAVSAFTPLAAAEAGFPYVDENCGFTQTFDAPPQRVVTLSSNATELMLALGLEDHMVGTTYQGEQPIGAQYRAAYETIPVLTPDLPTTEMLIEADADFVYAGYPDAYDPTYHTREQLHDLGIATRLNTEGCNAGPVTFDTLFEEIRTVAAIFGVPERAEEVVAEMETRLEAVDASLADVQPIPVFAYNGGVDAPGATLGHTMLNHVITRAGGTNIFADIASRWGRVSWEQIADRQPEYVVVYHHLDQSPEDRIAILNENPTIATVPAIVDQKFVIAPSILAQPGPRTIEAVERLARAFHPEAFSD